MESVSLELVEKIRTHINEEYLQNDLINNRYKDWLKVTSALDTIEDATSAINFYVSAPYPNELGGKYLYTYGLLQALYVVQDCAVSISIALLNKTINFVEYPDIKFVRDVRDDIQHATNRGRGEKSFVYLTQWNLSKYFFQYNKQTENDSSYTPQEINVNDFINKNVVSINEILNSIEKELSIKFEEYKDKYRSVKMQNIFNGLLYAEEKMSENLYMGVAGYESTKKMLKSYKSELDKRYVSWKETSSDRYEIECIEEIYDVLDNRMNDIESNETYEIIKKILIDDLCKHFDKLKLLAIARDEYFDDKKCSEININICPAKDNELKE